MKTSVRIGAFEIDDAELHGESPGERTLTIPCKSDPDLCMQLDAWDAETSVPAILNGEHSVLFRNHYDPKSDAWVMRLGLTQKEPVARRVIYSSFSHFPPALTSPTLSCKVVNIEDVMFALVLFVCYLDGGCEDIVVDIYDTEQQCLYSMDDQRIRHGGCFPVEDFIDGFWRPAQQYSDF
ncbi:conserved domain protein [Salmonella enterica subsp. salamae]|nr:conserved domain protein [Salmonella enterica subsp. salamae]